MCAFSFLLISSQRNKKKEKFGRPRRERRRSFPIRRVLVGAAVATRPESAR